MPEVCVQFQPGRVTPADEERVLNAFRRAVPAAEETAGDDGGRYVNLAFKTPSAAAGWTAVSAVLDLPAAGVAARASCIVTCQGEHGWDDYLLLHHYDPTVVADFVPAARDDQ
ncbi:MAG: hypothetical protein JWO31_2647 [Phycisphaerales bacterium]|nr:hypothetical protein [Phycisphaerales bacterium]